VPSCQCKKGFDWCAPMGYVDSLCLLFINLNFRALVSRPHCVETALELYRVLNLFAIIGKEG
jgi:hypothetical protein